jgi:signal transduction histidine kinase
MNLNTALQSLVAARSANEDVRRKEFILNILLIATILLLAISLASSSILSLFESAYVRQNDRMSLIVLCVVLGIFVSLYVLSSIGWVESASFIFVSIFFLLSLYFAYRWGPDVLIAVLYYALTITMAGILLDSRMGFAVAAAFGVLIPVINYFQTNGLLAINSYWRTEHMQLSDAFLVSIILIIIATVAWLSNREIRRSLIRARKSEAELKIERDLLEERVIERTEELQKVQMEKMSQTYHFVEFGRLASGLFHDLSNPITSLSMHIENMAVMQVSSNKTELNEFSEDISRAKSTMLHMQKLMESMRRHLIHESVVERFSVSELVVEAVHTLSSYARQKNVDLAVNAYVESEIFGDPIAFVQILTNLISNAIESFGAFPGAAVYTIASERHVHVRVSNAGNGVVVSVRDTGPGIPAANQGKIFEPFFSTKGSASGLGIGLSLAKRLVENRFGGSMSVESEIGKGTTFTIYLPAREP